MNKCENCKVNVHPQHKICPLCGKYLGPPIESATSYPQYAITGAGFTLQKLFLFSLAAVSVIIIFINIFTYDQASTPWSVIVLLSLVFPWRIINLIIVRRVNKGRKILNSYGIISIYLIAIDLFTGFNKWSTTYIIPFLTILVALIFTLLAARGSKKLNEYLGNLIAIFFISICPIIIFIFSLSTQMWMSLIALLYCLLTVFGLIIFMGGNFKQEIKKRFHY